MKTFKILIVLMFANAFIASANIEKDVTIEFSLDDFILTMVDDTTVSINSDKYIMSFDEVNGAPALPYVVREIEIPDGFSFVKEMHQIECSTAMNNVWLPKICYYDTDDNGWLTPINPRTEFNMANRIDVRFSRIHKIGNKSIAQFLISPFSWNAANKSLIFNSSVSLKIELCQNKVINNKTARKMEKSIIKQMMMPDDPINEVEYVIFTNNDLFPAFKKLSDWKCSKGVSTLVIPIESLPIWDESYDDMLNIKFSIYWLSDLGCKYVLLAGDENVIPVAKCYGQVSDESTTIESISNIPTDLFYSCLNGNLDWDANGNGIKGEAEDNIDLTQYVAVSRASVSTLEEAEAFVSKIIDYESHPEKNWNQEMLRVGQVFSDNKVALREEYDFRKESRCIAASKVLPYWNGSISELYSFREDTNVSNAELSKETFSSQLNKGYAFVDFSGGDGTASFWLTKIGELYNCTEAKAESRLHNTNNTIISSSGKQNLFTCTGYSISEGFIRGANNGVLAFWGAAQIPSKDILFDNNFNSDSDATPNPSYLGTYIGTFHQKLFEGNKDVVSIGDAVRDVKDEFSPHTIYNGFYRWLQYSVNLLGDAEMPVYIHEPKHISSVNIEYSDNSITVNTGSMKCDIAIVKEYKSNDIRNGCLAIYYREKDVNNASFSGIEGSGILSISKKGYVPVIIPFDSGSLYVQSDIISGNYTLSADKIVIGKNVTALKPEGEVTFSEGKITAIAKELELQPGTEVELGTELDFRNI